VKLVYERKVRDLENRVLREIFGGGARGDAAV